MMSSMGSQLTMIARQKTTEMERCCTFGTALATILMSDFLVQNLVPTTVWKVP